MRKLEKGNVLAVRAIGGLHVVSVAWDFVEGQEAKRDGLLGFAIERSELDNGEVIERYFLRGIKRFKSKDEGLAPGTPMPTSEHPVQSFQWGDYTVKPKTTYRYKIMPVYGKPKLIELDGASATTVEITTEAEQGFDGDDHQARHDIYFNRGAAGSQAYARKFGTTKPDETKPESDQMTTLPNGIDINVIEPVCFLGTKLAAFRSPTREHHDDAFLSRDFGDMVRVIDGRPMIAPEVSAAREDLRSYVQEQFARVLEADYLEEAIVEHVDPGRENLVIERIRSFLP